MSWNVLWLLGMTCTNWPFCLSCVTNVCVLLVCLNDATLGSIIANVLRYQYYYILSLLGCLGVKLTFSISKTGYRRGVCPGWFHLYWLILIVRHAKRARMTKWKVLPIAGFEPRCRQLFITVWLKFKEIKSTMAFIKSSTD